MMENTPMSAADVAAVLGNRNGDGMGNMGEWIFGLIVLAAFLRGDGFGNGFGGNGNHGGYYGPQPVTEAALCNSMNFNDLMNAVARLGDNQQAIARQQDNAVCNLGYTALEQNAATRELIANKAAEASAQNAACCCDLKQLILETQYKNEAAKCEILGAVKEGDWNAERRCMEQKIDALTAEKTQMANAYQAEQTRNYIAEQMCGVPKMPLNFTYAVSPNWGWGQGCCNDGCRARF